MKPFPRLPAEKNPLGAGRHENHFTEERCPFCPSQASDRFELIFGTVAALRDLYPVSEQHFLIVPLRHCDDYFGMTFEEKRDADALLERLSKQIQSADPSVIGFNIGMNCGEVAGQTVPHAHIHLIPRRAGDTPQPKGGVRGVIPHKMTYESRP